eukprot:1157316-Pelagomonas_calceolata.AAC.2
MPATPSPAPKSATRFPRTSSGESSTVEARAKADGHARTQKAVRVIIQVALLVGSPRGVFFCLHKSSSAARRWLECRPRRKSRGPWLEKKGRMST